MSPSRTAFLPLRNCIGLMCRPVSGPTIDTTEPLLVGHEEFSAAQALWLDSILLALGLGNVEQAGPLWFWNFLANCPMSRHHPTGHALSRRLDPWIAETLILRPDPCWYVCCPFLLWMETIRPLEGLHNNQSDSWMTWKVDAKPLPNPTMQEQPPPWPRWDRTTQLSHQKREQVCFCPAYWSIGWYELF